MEISSEMHVLPHDKEESDCLVQTEIDIKAEPQDEAKFPVIADSSFEMCPNYDIECDTEELLIKIEYEDTVDELIQDPLDVGDDIKVEKDFAVDLVDKLKTEPTKREKDENLLEIDWGDSYGRESNQRQEQLFISNDSDQSRDKKYMCNECNKTFTLKSNFDRHLRIHTGEKPYSCDVCEKAFNQKFNLNKHMLIHSGEKSHVCDVCMKVFRDKSNLTKHKLIHSGNKPFVCCECGKSFRKNSDFVRHNRIHIGEKPYACDICDKAFVQKGDLTKHTRVHTGEKPYSCDICSKSFTRNTILKQHKKHHKN